MSFLLRCVAKDLRRIRRDPGGLLLSLAIPLIVAFLMRLAFGGGGGGTPTAEVLVADHDNSFVSGFLTGALNQGPLADLFSVEKVEEAEGRRRMDKGHGSALLVIPAGFGNAVLSNAPSTLQLVTNPAQTILPGMVEEALSMMVEATFYLQQLVGAPMRSFASGPPAGAATFPDTAIASTAVAINRTVDRLVPYLSPPVLDVETPPREAEEASSGPNIGLLFLPGMLLMGLIFMGQGMSDEFWKEKREGTLRRAAAGPAGMAPYLLGKILAGAIVIGLASLVGLIAARFIFAVPIPKAPVAWAWLTLSGTVLFLLFTTIQFFAGSARGGNVLTTVVLFPAIMIGGSFFPFEVMPDWMAAVGRWTPNGWALMKFKAILDGSITPPGLLTGAAVLAGFAVVLFLVSWSRLRGPFVRT